MSTFGYQQGDSTSDYFVFDREDKSPFERQLDLWIRNGVVTQLRRLTLTVNLGNGAVSQYVMVTGHPQDIQFLNMMYEKENRF